MQVKGKIIRILHNILKRGAAAKKDFSRKGAMQGVAETANGFQLS